MKLFLVVELSEELMVPNSAYRTVNLSGRTYTEDGYRDWAKRIWEVDRELPLVDMALLAKGYGFHTLEVIA